MMQSVELCHIGLATPLLDEAVNKMRELHVSYKDLPPRVKRELQEWASKNGYPMSLIINYINGTRWATQDRSSLQEGDAINTVLVRAMDQYKKEQDEAVLNAENIVKAYNAMLQGQAQKAIDFVMACLKNMSNEDAQRAIAEAGLQPVLNALRMVLDMQGAVDKTHGAGMEIRLTEAEIRQMVINCVYQPSNDPEEIKAILKARLAMYEAMVGTLSTMLDMNYAMLGITKDQAKMLSVSIKNGNEKERTASIRQVKQLIIQNKKKFQPRDGMFDFRSVGGGVLFYTTDKMGLDVFTAIDHILGVCLNHDATVLAHGGSQTKKGMKYNNEVLHPITKKVEDLISKIEKLEDEKARIMRNIKRDESPEVKKIREEFGKKIDSAKKEALKLKAVRDKIAAQLDRLDPAQTDAKEIETLRKQLDQANVDLAQAIQVVDRLITDMNGLVGAKNMEEYKKQVADLNQEIADAKKKIQSVAGRYQRAWYQYARIENGLFSGKKVWYCQPVRTEKSSGALTDVNEICRQLVREGFKNICIMSCNPGHHELDKDLREMKDVTFKVATNSLLAEGTYGADEISEFSHCYDIMNETELHLMEACEELGFSYHEVESLNEAAIALGDEIIDEGVSDLWAKIKNIIKLTAVKFSNLFKRGIEKFRRMIDKIHGFFKDVKKGKTVEDKLADGVPNPAIAVDGDKAKFEEKAVTSWSELESSMVRSCESIGEQIQSLEKRCMDSLKDLNSALTKIQNECASSEDYAVLGEAVLAKVKENRAERKLNKKIRGWIADNYMTGEDELDEKLKALLGEKDKEDGIEIGIDFVVYYGPTDEYKGKKAWGVDLGYVYVQKRGDEEINKRVEALAKKAASTTQSWLRSRNVPFKVETTTKEPNLVNIVGYLPKDVAEDLYAKANPEAQNESAEELMSGWLNEAALGTFDEAKATKILEKCPDFINGPNGDTKIKVTPKAVISYFCEDTYDGKFEGLSTSDIATLGCMIYGTPELTKRFYGADTEEEEKEFDKYQLIPLGAVGNGDHFLFSLRSKKVWYYSHDSEPSIFEYSTPKFEDWRSKRCR